MGKFTKKQRYFSIAELRVLLVSLESRIRYAKSKENQSVCLDQFFISDMQFKHDQISRVVAEMEKLGHNTLDILHEKSFWKIGNGR